MRLKIINLGLLAFALIALITVPAPLAFAEEDNIVNIQQAPDSSFIYDTSITDLSSADAYYDNQTVQVKGEVIGDSLFANPEGNNRWIILASQNETSDATISVFMSHDDAAKIDTFGKYNKTGTVLQVRGTFHLVCPEHEGETDLHAEAVSVVDKGREYSEEFDIGMFVPGIVAVLGGLALLALFYEIRKRHL